MDSPFLTENELSAVKKCLFDFVVNVAEMPTASQHRIAILPQMTELLLNYFGNEFALTVPAAEA